MEPSFALAAAVISNLVALLEVGLALRVRAAVPALSSLDAKPPATWPLVSIVVPARDEAHGIEGALRSKLACGYPNLEIIVVDDRSTDGTGAIAARLGASDPRVVVTRIDHLPAGWLGKLHAMSVGAARARGEFLLFSDADVHVERGTLERVVAYAEAHAVDMVAAMPKMSSVSVGLDASVASMLRLLAVAGRTWSANDDDSQVGIGVGAFNLIRRRALAASPGLDHLRMEMVDDVALGSMLKASGARTRFFAGRHDVHLVFAQSLRVLAHGTEKGGGLFGFSLLKTMLAAGALFAIDFGLPVAGFVSGGALAALAIVQLSLVTLAHAIVVRHFRGPMRGVMFWPLGALIGVAMLARSGALAWWRGAIVWRGTRYSKAEIERGRRWVNGRIVLG